MLELRQAANIGSGIATEATVITEGNSQPASEKSLYDGFYPWLLLSLAGFGLYFNQLASWTFVDPGETYYSEAAREMVESGEWIVPHLNYQVYFSKPILTFWLTAASYQALGFGPLAARLPFACLALLLVLVTYKASRTLFDKKTALLAGLLTASAPLMMAFSKLSPIDIAFTSFLDIAVFAFAMSAFARQRLWWIVFHLALGLSILTKGPAGLLLFLIGTALFLLAERPKMSTIRQWLQALKPAYGLPIFLASFVPWYYLVWKATKGLFLQVFIIYENLARFSGKTNFHKGSPLYYFPVLAYGLAPWFLLLPQTIKITMVAPFLERLAQMKKPTLEGNYRPHAAAMKKEAPGTKAESEEAPDAKEIRRLSLFYLSTWSVSTFLFFSISKTQLDTYLLPTIAPFAVLIAATMITLTSEKEDKQAGTGAAITETADADGSKRQEGSKSQKETTSKRESKGEEQSKSDKADKLAALEDQRQWDRLWLHIVQVGLAVLCLLTGLGLTALGICFDGFGKINFTVLVAGLLTTIGAVFQSRQLLKRNWQTNLFTAAITISAMLALMHPIGFAYFTSKTQNNMMNLALRLKDSREEICVYGPFKPSILSYLARPVDTISNTIEFKKVVTIPADGYSYGPTPSGRKQLVISDDEHARDLLTRKDLIFVERARTGDWAVYELTNGYAPHPKSLEESFKWVLFAGNSLFDASNWGPLTVPLGGGDADWYKHAKKHAAF
jgi:4-amino-4-deoxy-L-arabinose transferase-like glycosyltransferase